MTGKLQTFRGEFLTLSTSVSTEINQSRKRKLSHLDSMKEKREDAFYELAITPSEAGILKTLLYFDIFSYPLGVAEVHRAQPDAQMTLADSRQSLEKFHAAGWIEKESGFYGFGDLKEKVPRRQKGNELADMQLEVAKRRSKFISNFPFVRAVMISGSLSKEYMDADADIDFFVVTKPGRLWLARTLLILYKKIFLLNSHKTFCMNYFIDEAHLEIEDKNIFTATEVAFLIPTYNKDLYTNFRAANSWTDAYYPIFKVRGKDAIVEGGESRRKRFSEWLFSGSLGEKLDAYFLRITLRRWQKKFDHLTPEHFEVALRSRQYVSKHHPGNYQAYVMGKLQESWKALAAQIKEDHQVSQEAGE